MAGEAAAGEAAAAEAAAAEAAVATARGDLRRCLWLYAAAITLYVVAMRCVPPVIMAMASLDDALFLRQAAYLLNGQWLGPYDASTLVKGPFYPMVAAVSWALGVPLMLTQSVLYAVACWLLVRGLRPWLRWETAAFLVFLVLLLNPMVYAEGQMRAVREGVYVPLAVLIMAGAVWWARLAEAGIRVRAAVAGALGLALAAFWLTREEGIWIVPPLVLALGLPLAARLLAVRAGRRTLALREAALTGLAVVVAASGVGAVMLANRVVYGVPDVVEFKQDAFLSAYGALSRIRHDVDIPYVPVPRAALERAYGVSPAAAELRASLSDGPGLRFPEFGCQAHGVEPCDGEIRGGWFMWALRKAADDAGHHRTAADARAFYQRVGEELDAACDAGRLDCLPPRRTMMPPFYPDSVVPAAAAAARALLFMATLQHGGVPRAPHSCRVDDCTRPWTLPILLDLLGADLFVIPADSADPIEHRAITGSARQLSSSQQGALAAGLPSQHRAALVARALDRVYALYRAVLPAACLIGLAGIAVSGAVALRQRRVDPLLAVAVVAGATVLTRVVLIAYLDTVSMPGINTLYLSPAYPFLLLFAAVAPLALACRLAGGISSWARPRGGGAMLGPLRDETIGGSK